MIRFVYADQLGQHPILAATMFQDRARVFRDRMGWDVTVTGGEERDAYDALNPLYLIWEMPDGTHGGSMRVMPTVGRTMVNDVFQDIAGGVRIESPRIWECTRFCCAPGHADAARTVSSGLMLAGLELGLRFGLMSAVGVVEAATLPLYRAIGHAPDLLGRTGPSRRDIAVCLWEISAARRATVSARTGIAAETVAGWFEASFPLGEPMAA